MSAVRARHDVPFTLTEENTMNKIYGLDGMDGRTSSLAAKQIGGKGGLFDLVLVASIRVRELKKGHAPKINTGHGITVTALCEIEQGFIGRDYLRKLK
jgi:DNA-directed RNA polymerase subunit K/omega